MKVIITVIEKREPGTGRGFWLWLLAPIEELVRSQRLGESGDYSKREVSRANDVVFGYDSLL